MAHGDTQEAALRHVNEATALWIDAATEYGDPIPDPGTNLRYWHSPANSSPPNRRPTRSSGAGVTPGPGPPPGATRPRNSVWVRSPREAVTAAQAEPERRITPGRGRNHHASKRTQRPERSEGVASPTNPPRAIAPPTRPGVRAAEARQEPPSPPPVRPPSHPYLPHHPIHPSDRPARTPDVHLRLPREKTTMTELANTSRSLSPETEQMSHDEKYLFDLLGFVIVRDVLSEEHLKLANEAIDSMELTPSPEYFGESVALRGENRSTRLGNSEDLMELPHPWCEPFREMLAHPKTTPHLNTILSEGWRLDHGPGLIAMDKGCSGGMLHGNFDNAPYFYREGRIFTGLCVIEYLLADEGPGDGGDQRHRRQPQGQPRLPGEDAQMGAVPGIRDRDQRQGRRRPSSSARPAPTEPSRGTPTTSAAPSSTNTTPATWPGAEADFRGSRPSYWDELTPPQQAALLLPSHHSRRPKPSNGYAGPGGGGDCGVSRRVSVPPYRVVPHGGSRMSRRFPDFGCRSALRTTPQDRWT